MSKGIGQKIGIRFTENIESFTVTPVEGYSQVETTDGVLTASGTYSGYSVESLRDANTSTMWQTRTAGAYIQISYDVPRLVTAFRYYRKTSYYSMGYSFMGSTDGVNFDVIHTGNSSSGTGYVTVSLKNKKPYKVYRLVINSLTTMLNLYELSLFYEPYKNEIAFCVTGFQRQYVSSPLIERVYFIERVDRYPDDPKAILLTFEPYDNRFNNVEGSLRVTYNASLGDLLGRGGAMQSFETTFLPVDLIQKPNPHQPENISVILQAAIVFSNARYTRSYNTENIVLNANASVNLIDVSIVNP